MTWIKRLKGLGLIIIAILYLSTIGSQFSNAMRIGYENRESGILVDIMAPFMYVMSNFVIVAPSGILFVYGVHWLSGFDPSCSDSTTEEEKQ